MPRPQFTLRALLVLMVAVGCFFGGIRFERERRRRADEAARLADEVGPLMFWAGRVWNRGTPDVYVTGDWFDNQPTEHAKTD